jgi:hypothetical protein
MDQEPTPLRRLVFALRIPAIALVAVLLWDAALFRSGVYMHWVEPASTAGATRTALMQIDQAYIPGRRNVLVLGNSQVGEALSPSIADKTTIGSDLHFVNGFIAGSDPRVWYHLLREVDPKADRYSAVVVAVHYDLREISVSMADYSVDIGYVAPLIRLQDIGEFPASFDNPALRSQARRAILFPTQSLRRDIVAMLASPKGRYDHVRDYDKTVLGNRMRYPGRPNALPDLSVDPATFQPFSWDGVDEKAKKGLTTYFASLRSSPTPAVLDGNERYYREWLGRIAAPYRANGIPVVLMEVPRGPWYATLKPVPQPRGAVRDLIDSGLVEALPGDAFVDLEYPRYFFDGEHMNRAGRELFTPRLAQRIAAILH